MDMIQIDDYASRLYAAHGDRAEYEAAQKAKAAEENGDSAGAEQWQRVRAKIHQLRGPRVT
ncbi:hypothetical protein [Amaricoccus tamworthensis]|uniref:hypothetical protein n=1 Tax=Amaricoccus tamworthensis TaxID=57002 RepID=UPI003C7E84BD